MIMMPLKIVILLAALAGISLITLILYGADKIKAKRGAWRIPEKVLLGFSFLGGAVGGLIGMNLFRHKTKHWSFWVVNVLGLIWQVAAVVAVIVLL